MCSTRRHVLTATVSIYRGWRMYSSCLSCYVNRDNVVGIATRYGLDGPGIESRWRQDFPHPSTPALGHTQTSIHWVPVIFPGGKAAGASRLPPIPV